MAAIDLSLCKAGVRSSEGKGGGAGNLGSFPSLERAGTPESNSSSQAGAGLDARTEGEISAATKTHVPAWSSPSYRPQLKRRLTAGVDPSCSSPRKQWFGFNIGSSWRPPCVAVSSSGGIYSLPGSRLPRLTPSLSHRVGRALPTQCLGTPPVPPTWHHRAGGTRPGSMSETLAQRLDA